MSFRILWQNWHRIATLTASSENSDWPLVFLQNEISGLVHRTTGKTSEWWKWDLGEMKELNYFIFYNHNFSQSATIQLQANSIDDWANPPVNETLQWSSNKIAKYFSSAQSYRYWRLVVQDSLNSQSYLQGGWAYLGKYFEPSRYFSKIEIEDIDPSLISFSDDGQGSAVEKTKYWRRGYEFQGLLDSEIEEIRKIFEEIGMTKSFFVIEDTNDFPNSLYYVKNITNFKYSLLFYNRFNFSLSIEEMR